MKSRERKSGLDGSKLLLKNFKKAIDKKTKNYTHRILNVLQFPG